LFSLSGGVPAAEISQPFDDGDIIATTAGPDTDEHSGLGDGNIADGKSL
jgi:hypothetical protein